MKQRVEFSEEVRLALEQGRAVVALESTIISHGMPYPKNVETALSVEQVIRENGAVPATIAIIGGVLKAGLSRDELEYFGKKGTAITKVSRRDIPAVVARKEDGATTVAATMIIAHMAGIDVFATGGIGGVHRGAEMTMDISADLEELSRTPVMVICAGAKAILDLKLTMEVLETKGVPVVGYQTDELPAFYSRESGIRLNTRTDSPEDLASIWKALKDLNLGNGMLVANPIPEQYSMDSKAIGAVIEEAICEMNSLGIKGKEVTPFLLDKVQKLTGGDSLEANIKLVLNNAKLAARTACSLAKADAKA